MLHSFSSGFYYYYSSPAGNIFIAATQKGICKLSFTVEILNESRAEIHELHPLLQKAIGELNQYFSGNIKSFTTPLDLNGSEFQHRVWQSVKEIPYGKSVSYLQLSRKLRQPEAIRAVANANARNPVLIFIPCHRVIGSTGELTGYAGGLARKKFLLEMEGNLIPSGQLTLL